MHEIQVVAPKGDPTLEILPDPVPATIPLVGVRVRVKPGKVRAVIVLCKRRVSAYNVSAITIACAS